MKSAVRDSRFGLRLILALGLFAVIDLAVASSDPPQHLAVATVLTSTATEGLTPDALVQAQSALIAAQSQFDNIKLRIAALRSGARRSRNGVAYDPAGAGGALGMMWQSSLGEDDQKPSEIGADFSRWGFFATGSFGRGTTDPGLTSPGSRFDLSSLTAGVDYRYSDAWVIGGSLGVNRQDTNLTARQGQIDSNGWSISAYGTHYTQDSWYTDAVVSYAHHGFDMLRTIGSQDLSSNSNGASVSAAASFGRDFNKGPWTFGPVARLQYTHINFDRFTERVSGVGPVAPQEVRTHSQTSLSGVLGGQVTYAHSAAWGVLIPHFDAEWQHEFHGDPTIVETNFVGAVGNAVIKGDPTDQNFLRLGVGASFVLTHGRSGFIYYDRLFGADRLSKENVGVGIRIEF